jgi:hypothetical protein
MLWAQAQAAYADVMITVHATATNHFLRNKFRQDFNIDCVLFHPDQEAELHTDVASHVWMAVTDWTDDRQIDTEFSREVFDARFTILVDEEFELSGPAGLPIRSAKRQIERTTRAYIRNYGIPVSRARVDPTLPSVIASNYAAGGYVHVYVEP